MDIIDRETGQLPLSIGTSLALEGLFGIHPNQPKFPPRHRQISQVWINLRTMVRNLYASMTSEDAKKIDIESSVLYVMQELETLYGLPQQMTKHQFSVVIYYNDLLDIQRKFPKALKREYRTERQQYFQRKEEIVLNNVLASAQDSRIPIRVIGEPPHAIPAQVAMITHYPHELLWRFEFEVLFLLESHTGRLKTYSQWHTKLSGIKDEDRIPFNRLTLQIFGDGVVLAPQPKKLRDEVKQIAHTRQWTAVTSMDKVRDDLRNYGGETLKDLIRRLSNV